MNVRTAPELANAIAAGEREIEIDGTITGSPMITLAPGVTLRGGTLEFGAKGIRLTRDNTLADLAVVVPDDEVAILNDLTVDDFGTLSIRNVRTRGQVLILADGAVRSGHIQIEGLDIESADVRGRDRRPHGFGVEALQGALTVWNCQPDSAVRITAEILDVRAGRAGKPVRGSGIFVGGHGDWAGKGDGGVLAVSHLRTGEVHTNGGIPGGTPDLISGGVFVISGAEVDRVTNEGPVTTYGQNDMVLDNWGAVKSWTANGAVTSEGPSGIGFVNFGAIDLLDVRGPVVTHGKGARGFNLYDGSLHEAHFASISTTGDGSIGVQVSQPLGTLRVDGDVTTSGGEGLSLVKGVQMVLKAIAVSVKPGGSIEHLSIGGKVATSGDNVSTLEIAGPVTTVRIDGGVHASGKGSNAIVATVDVPALADVQASATDGLVRSRPS